MSKTIEEKRKRRCLLKDLLDVRESAAEKEFGMIRACILHIEQDHKGGVLPRGWKLW